jgi:hypothetical protein
MRGPDFVLSKVASWSEPTGADAQLALQDGSRWTLKASAANYAVLRSFITHAASAGSEIFLSGDKASGLVDRVAEPRHLAAQRIGKGSKDGRYAIQFWGPPSIYYLRIDRPWFDQSLALLRESAKSGAFIDSPDLLVSIDTVTSEIMDVRPLRSR